jgi:hypothetical protein
VGSSARARPTCVVSTAALAVRPRGWPCNRLYRRGAAGAIRSASFGRRGVVRQSPRYGPVLVTRIRDNSKQRSGVADHATTGRGRCRPSPPMRPARVGSAAAIRHQRPWPHGEANLRRPAHGPGTSPVASETTVYFAHE